MKIYKTPALSLSEIGLVHSIGTAGIPVYCGTFFRDNPALYSRFTKKRFMFSTFRGEQFIEELVKVGEQLTDQPVLYSDDDGAIQLISRHRDRLSSYFRFLFPGADMVERILDKGKFAELCSEFDLPAPKTFQIESGAELEDCMGRLTFPTIIKPIYKSDWWTADFEEIVGEYKKAYKCNTPGELAGMYKKVSRINPRLVIQEYVEGGDNELFSVNMFVDRDGNPKGYFAAQKHRVYPIEAGQGTCILTVRDESIKQVSMEIVRRLNLKGLVNIQFKKDIRTGEPKLMEIHLRNSVWSYLGPAAGMNLAALYYRHLHGELIPEGLDYNENIKYIDLTKDFKAFRQYRKAGVLNWSSWLKSVRNDAVLGGMLKSDPLPIMLTFWYLLKRRWVSRLAKNAQNDIDIDTKLPAKEKAA